MLFRSKESAPEKKEEKAAEKLKEEVKKEDKKESVPEVKKEAPKEEVKAEEKPAEAPKEEIKETPAAEPEVPKEEPKVEEKPVEKEEKGFFILREERGMLFILDLPEDAGQSEDQSSFSRDELKDMIQNKMVFKFKTFNAQTGSEAFKYATFIEKPYRHILDRLFFTAIILFLFFIYSLTIHKFYKDHLY